MKLNIKNFSNDKYRINVEFMSSIVVAYYTVFDEKLKFWFTEKVFIEFYDKENHSEGLKKVLKRVESELKIELIKNLKAA